MKRLPFATVILRQCKFRGLLKQAPRITDSVLSAPHLLSFNDRELCAQCLWVPDINCSRWREVTPLASGLCFMFILATPHFPSDNGRTTSHVEGRSCTTSTRFTSDSCCCFIAEIAAPASSNFCASA